MAGKRVLLIYPPQLYAPTWGRVNVAKPHLVGLFSFLRQKGMQAEVLDLENELGRPATCAQAGQFRKKAQGLISRRRFDIAAISCYTSLNYLGSIEVALACRQAHSSSIIVVGGYHPSALPGDFIYKDSPFDFIVQGEGEMALLDLCRGRYIRRGWPRCIRGRPLGLTRGFSLDWQAYPYADPERFSHLYLSRGCPFNCAFCTEPGKGLSAWRSLSVYRALEEIERLIAIRDPRKIGICDACFGLRPDWRRGFILGLAKKKIDRLFGAEMRVDLLEKSDIDLFGRLNFMLILGLESCSQRMLGIMRKTVSPRRYLERCRLAVDYLDKKGIPYKLFLIFNHPGETPKTYRETLGFLSSLYGKKKKVSGYVVAQNYAFFPGSRIHTDLRYYEARYGTFVRDKAWWKKPVDHNILARDIAPSSELPLATGENRYWEKDIVDLNRRIFEKMPPAVKAFWWQAFNSGRDTPHGRQR